MHEFSIGERIVTAVLAELGRLGPDPVRLCGVRVVVGRLHQIVPDYLVHAYDILSRDTPAEGSTIELDIRPVVCRCRVCGWQGEIDLPVFRCAQCASLEVDMVSGRELYLEHLEVDADPTPSSRAAQSQDHTGAP